MLSGIDNWEVILVACIETGEGSWIMYPNIESYLIVLGFKHSQWEGFIHEYIITGYLYHSGGLNKRSQCYKTVTSARRKLEESPARPLQRIRGYISSVKYAASFPFTAVSENLVSTVFFCVDHQQYNILSCHLNGKTITWRLDLERGLIQIRRNCAHCQGGRSLYRLLLGNIAVWAWYYG